MTVKSNTGLLKVSDVWVGRDCWRWRGREITQFWQDTGREFTSTTPSIQFYMIFMTQLHDVMTTTWPGELERRAWIIEIHTTWQHDDYMTGRNFWWHVGSMSQGDACSPGHYGTSDEMTLSLQWHEHNKCTHNHVLHNHVAYWIWMGETVLQRDKWQILYQNKDTVWSYIYVCFLASFTSLKILEIFH